MLGINVEWLARRHIAHRVHGMACMGWHGIDGMQIVAMKHFTGMCMVSRNLCMTQWFTLPCPPP